MTKFKKATFGAGCFWGVQYKFDHISGVVQTEVGYEGGTLQNPSYEDVCTNSTGHAEVVEVTYDPDKVSYQQLLDVFWQMHDPTQFNRQGPDVGTQYRSIILFHDNEQKKVAEAYKSRLQKSGNYQDSIVTEIVPHSTFYKAEEYHQKYLNKRGKKYC